MARSKRSDRAMHRSLLRSRSAFQLAAAAFVSTQRCRKRLRPLPRPTEPCRRLWFAKHPVQVSLPNGVTNAKNPRNSRSCYSLLPAA